MKNETILKKAIEKAVKNGFNYGISSGTIIEVGINRVFVSPPESIIFSHDFAKAFWGEEGYKAYHYGYFEWCDATKECDWDNCDCDEYQQLRMPNWQYHLQQMVVLPEDKRIKYLEKFIK